MSKTTALNRARRRLALRLAEHAQFLIDREDGWDLDDATDLFAAVLPDTRVEAEAENAAAMEDCKSPRPWAQKGVIDELRRVVGLTDHTTHGVLDVVREATRRLKEKP